MTTPAGPTTPNPLSSSENIYHALYFWEDRKCLFIFLSLTELSGPILPCAVFFLISLRDTNTFIFLWTKEELNYFMESTEV